MASGFPMAELGGISSITEIRLDRAIIDSPTPGPLISARSLLKYFVRCFLEEYFLSFSIPFTCFFLFAPLCLLLSLPFGGSGGLIGYSSSILGLIATCIQDQAGKGAYLGMFSHQRVSLQSKASPFCGLLAFFVALSVFP